MIRWLDDELPPVPDVAARLGRITDPLGFPRVFAGLEPTPAAPVTGPLPAQVRAAAAAAARSTVRIRGVGCGGVLVGSGWVAAPGLVVTNAHVVAGIADPVVEDADGEHRAVAVVFDPDTDVAILRTSGLDGPPLAVTGDRPRTRARSARCSATRAADRSPPAPPRCATRTGRSAATSTAAGSRSAPSSSCRPTCGRATRAGRSCCPTARSAAWSSRARSRPRGSGTRWRRPSCAASSRRGRSGSVSTGSCAAA